MKIKTCYILPSIVLVCAGVSSVIAEEIPRTGEYKIIYTGVNTAPSKPMPIGENLAVVVSTVTMTAVNTAGGGFLHNMAGRCIGMATLDNGAKTVENHGRCVYADAGGDQIFEKYDYPVQAQGTNLRGTAEWTGGTGKFAGVSGNLEITNSRLSSVIDGIVQVSGTKVGRYSFQNTTSSLK